MGNINPFLDDDDEEFGDHAAAPREDTILSLSAALREGKIDFDEAVRRGGDVRLATRMTAEDGSPYYEGNQENIPMLALTELGEVLGNRLLVAIYEARLAAED